MKLNAALIGIVLLASSLCAQASELPQRIHVVGTDSGVLPAHRDQYPRVSFREIVEIPEAPWIRVFFETATLGGDSYLIITSLEDGDSQVLTQETLEQWNYSTARFRGSSVSLELVSKGEAPRNRVKVSHVVAGGPPEVIESVCAATDTRVPSANDCTARLIGKAICTGSITNRAPGADPADRCMISAGHCFGLRSSSVTVAGGAGANPAGAFEFQVYSPPSLGDCAVVLAAQIVGSAVVLCNAVATPTQVAAAIAAGLNASFDPGYHAKPIGSVVCFDSVPSGSGKYFCRIIDAEESNVAPPACAGGYNLTRLKPVNNMCSGGNVANGRIAHTGGWRFTKNFPVNIVEFEPIPNSVACAPLPPPVAKQFAIDFSTLHFQDDGRGDDWSLFRCFRNATTGNTVFEEQACQFVLGGAPAIGAAASKFGYGAQGDPVGGVPELGWCVCAPGDILAPLHVTQQTSAGTITGLVGTRIDHNVQTCGGDSGSPLIVDGVVKGIHTHGDCAGAVPTNSGTVITHAGLVAAFAAECDSIVTAIGDILTPGAPSRITLFPNRPNPFNPITTMAFEITGGRVHVVLNVYDVSGRIVRHLFAGGKNSGVHHITWDGRDGDGGELVSGIYFYRISTGSESFARKMVLLK